MTTASDDGGLDAARPDTRRPGSLLRDRGVQGLVSIGVVAGFLIGLLVFGKPQGLPPAWGDIPTWITAIATIGLLAGAIITAIYASKAFSKQATEVATLVDENRRQAAERRRAQAARVFIGVPRGGIRLVEPYAQNASDFPVFDAQFWYSIPGGIAGPDDLEVIMPGPVVPHGKQMSEAEAREHAILTFRDAEGLRWIRMADGTLREQTRPTARESILEALGLPPAPPDPPEAPEPPAGPETPQAQ